MRACDWDDDWWHDYLFADASYFVPDLQVDMPEEPDEPEPRLLGPDGEPLPRLVFKFGFAPRPVMEDE